MAAPLPTLVVLGDPDPRSPAQPSLHRLVPPRAGAGS